MPELQGCRFCNGVEKLTVSTQEAAYSKSCKPITFATIFGKATEKRPVFILEKRSGIFYKPAAKKPLGFCPYCGRKIEKPKEETDASKKNNR